jgi:hypothetical protein
MRCQEDEMPCTELSPKRLEVSAIDIGHAEGRVRGARLDGAEGATPGSSA